MKVTTAQVNRLVTKWRKRLEIDSKWEIAIDINQTEAEENEELRDSEAHILTDDDTHSAHLVINAWHVDSAKHLDEIVVHEMVHVVMSPIEIAIRCAFGDRFHEFGRMILEQATDQIARSLVKN